MADAAFTFTVNSPIAFTYTDMHNVVHHVKAAAGSVVQFDNACDAWSYAEGYLTAQLGSLGQSAGVSTDDLLYQCSKQMLAELTPAPDAVIPPQDPPVTDPSATDQTPPEPGGEVTTPGLNPPDPQPPVTFADVSKAPGSDDGRPLASQVSDQVQPMPLSDAAAILAGSGVAPNQMDDALNGLERNDAPDGQRHPVHGIGNRQPAASLADPVALFTGQFVLRVVDVEIPSRGMPLRLTRSYKSGPAYFGPFGYNWDHDCNVYVRPLSNGGVAVWTGELYEDVYRPSPGGFEPPIGVFRRLEYEPADGLHGDRFVLTDRQGTRQIFERPSAWPLADRIPLLRTEDRHGNAQVLSYDPQGRFLRVTDHAGRFIECSYGTCGLVERVFDHTGRSWGYDHDPQAEHLVAVTTPSTPEAPNGLVTSYEYDSEESHPSLKHNVVAVREPGGGVVVENTYGTDPSSYDFARVIHQAYGGYEADFAATVLQYVPRLPDASNVPALRVETVDPGVLRVFTFNFRGDVLDERYRLTLDSSYRLVARAYRYDSQGNLVERRDPNGLGTLMEYDASNPDARARGNLLRTVLVAPPTKPAASREVARYTYEPRYQQIKAVRDERGSVTTYIYDYEETTVDHGDVIRVEHPLTTLPDGTSQSAVEQFAYNPFGQLVQHTSGEGHRVTYDYFSTGPSVGYLEREVIGAGVENQAETYQYDVYGNLTVITDAAGASIEHDFDATGHVLRTRRPPSAGSMGVTTYAYGPDGRLRSIDTPRGEYSDASLTDAYVRETIDYDPLGGIASITYGANTASPRRWSFERDAEGYPIRVADPLGRHLTIDYDERHCVLDQTLSDETTQRRTSCTYDLNGNRLSSTDGAGRTSHSEFDAWDRLHVLAGPATLGVSTRTQYDYGPGDEVLTAETAGVPGPGQAPATLVTMSQAFDERGRLIRRTQGAVSTTFVHDRDSNVVGYRDERGNQTSVTRDAAGRPLLLTDAAGNQIQYGYDTRGLLTTVDETDQLPPGNPPDHRHTGLVYDLRRRLVRIDEASGVSTTAEYDDRDLLSQVIDPLGHTTQYRHDVVGDLVEARALLAPPIGWRTHTWQRDAGGRVIATTGPTGSVTRYEYNLDDRWRTITSPNGSTHTREFDHVGQVTAETDPSASVARYDYGSDGFVRRVQFTAGPGVVPTLDHVYDRDGLGRVVAITRGTATWTFGYDEHSRLITETADGAVTAWHHDDTSGTADLQFPDGRVDRYHLDALDRLDTISLLNAGSHPLPGLTSGDVLAHYEYAGPRRLHRRLVHSGAETRYSYDPGARLAAITHTDASGNTLAATEYVYDDASRRRVIHATPAPTEPSWFALDDASRLTEARIGIATTPPVPGADQATQRSYLAALGTPPAPSVTRFDVNAADGITHVTSTDPAGTVDDAYTLDPLEQIISITRTGPSGSLATAVTYDPSGRRLSDDRYRYAYDVLGRLQTVTIGGTVELALTQDPTGRIDSYQMAGQPPVRIHWFGSRPLQEGTVGGAALRQRTLGAHPDELIFVTDTAHHFAHQDGHNDLTVVSDHNGAPTARYVYSPYGQARTFAGDGVTSLATPPIPPIFGGYRALGSTGLLDARARVYDPSLASFLQPDPRGAFNSSDLHAYAARDPIDLTDPTGEVAPVIAAAVIIGAVAGAGYAIYDATQHPEHYEGIKILLPLGYTFGGAAIGWGAALAGTAAGGLATLVTGGTTAAGVGTTATAGVTLQGFFVAGAEGAGAGTVWSLGFHQLFPEYVDPPSLKSVALDFATAGTFHFAGPAIRSAIPRSIWNSADLAVRETAEGFRYAFAGNWRAFGSDVPLVRRYGTQAIRRWFWDPRTYAWKSRQYWTTAGGAAGKDLHHWLIPNSARRMPLPQALEGIRQAGLNHLELPKDLNRWLGRYVYREEAFRHATLGLLAATGLGAASLTSMLLPDTNGGPAGDDTRQASPVTGIAAPQDNPLGTGNAKQ